MNLKNLYKNTNKLRGMMICIKITRLFKLKDNIFGKKVLNRSLLDLTLILYQQKLWKQKEIH